MYLFAKHCTNIDSFNPHNNSLRKILFILILQMGKLWHRGGQGPTVGKWQGQDLNPVWGYGYTMLLP